MEAINKDLMVEILKRELRSSTGDVFTRDEIRRVLDAAADEDYTRFKRFGNPGRMSLEERGEFIRSRLIVPRDVQRNGFQGFLPMKQFVRVG